MAAYVDRNDSLNPAVLNITHVFNLLNIIYKAYEITHTPFIRPLLRFPSYSTAISLVAPPPPLPPFAPATAGSEHFFF